MRPNDPQLSYNNPQISTGKAFNGTKIGKKHSFIEALGDFITEINTHPKRLVYTVVYNNYLENA